MLPAPLSHVPRVRDARTEPVRLPQTEQVLAAAAQVHPPHPATSAHCATQAQSKSTNHGLVLLLLNNI